MKNYKVSQLILILAPFVFSFAFGLDIYIPIVPQMTQIFDTSPALIQLTLSLFLFLTGVGQLLVGPFSDQYGRKIVFYLSAACYALGSLACAYSPNIGCLILSRVVSAMGACGMLATSFALVRDLYSNDESAQMYSYLNGAIGISPTFAPIIGGYLAVFFGWQSVFFFLAFIGLCSLFVAKQFIEETHKIEKRVNIDRHVFKRYLRVFADRNFLTYSTIAGLAEGVFFCFFSISPFIIINLLGIPTHEFGYYFAVFGSVIALGGIASGKVVQKFGMQATLITGISLMFIGGVSMLTWHFLASLSLAGFLIPMVIACTGAMFLVGISASGALESFGDIAGTASAGFGALSFGVSAIIGSILMYFPVNSTLPYGICIVLMGSLILLLFIVNEKYSFSSKNVLLSQKKYSN